MPYTLWLRGVLVGATDFGLGEQSGPHLAGVFHPTESGMMLLPALTAMAPALLDLDDLMKAEHLTDKHAGEDPDRVELHAPDGERVAFESILVSDLLETKRFGFRTTPIVRRHRQPDHADDPIRYLISATLAPPTGTLLA